MSLLKPSIQVLDKGLNLQTAKLLAPPGSVLDSLNYEQVDFQGQKRIDGYSRYDGNTLLTEGDLYHIDSEELYSKAELFEDAWYVDGKFLGADVGSYDNYIILAVWDHKLLAIFDSKKSRSDPPDPDEQYEGVLAANRELRNRVGPLPGAVSGLHWFNDRLYGISDMPVIQLVGTGHGLTVNTDIQDPYNETSRRTILRVYEDGGNTVIFLDGDDLSEWISQGDQFVYLTDGELNSYEILTYYPEVLVEMYPASIYEARNEQQVMDEDDTYNTLNAGWKFNHLGWEIKFRDGNIPYGGFTALNQNRQGVGVQGPTSIFGNNGRPLSLVQKVAITSGPAQVNGWKTSNTPTSYNLDPLALTNVDSSYIYADSYIEWNGDANTITTPDNDGSALSERPATSSVTVEV